VRASGDMLRHDDRMSDDPAYTPSRRALNAMVTPV
jgi:hypothetical protein